ncbi:hypothetical protein D0T49_07925 [Paludibacter sp. 221]|uniref:hypothetical protein n=1 Tax=Paludibacter sp. 221 TaxID=2302939 RepID=UPI0013D08569|nr:hypothetical protein [Paludibacter sp. 221]NDV46973.1 hypothetical protein [Paludibacter sp. 221]
MRISFLHKIAIFVYLTLLSVFTVYSQDKIKITPERNKDNSVTFYYEKFVPGSYSVTVEFSNMRNTHMSNYYGTIKNDNGILFHLKPVNKNNAITFSYKTRFQRGITNPKVDSLFVYALPYLQGSSLKYRNLKYAGETYLDKEKPESWKSSGFVSDNDTVCAARRGIVVDIVNEYGIDTVNVKYTSKKNKILIEHADGSFGSYSGFKKDNIFVEIGQVVDVQTPLGIAWEIAKEKQYFMSFFVSYYVQSKNQDKRESIYITPCFWTEEGVKRLDSKNEYKVVITDDILNKEVKKKKKQK